MAESGVSDTPAPLDRPPSELKGGRKGMEASPALTRAKSRQKPAISATQQDGLDGNPKAKETKKAAGQKAMAAPAAMDDAPVALKTSVTPLRLTKEDVAKKPDESENVVDGASHGVPTQRHPAEPGPE